jgi:3-oxoadipate enol-lactonase
MPKRFGGIARDHAINFQIERTRPMKLHCEAIQASEPDAPTIAFLHAFPMDSRMWEHQMLYLRGRANVVTLDIRGYGQSRVAEDAPFSMSEFAGDVKETLDAAGIARCILAGCSMGGYTMFEFWRHWPDRVAGMILCDTRAEADDDAARARREAQIRRIRDEGPSFMPDFAEQNLLSPQTRAGNPDLVRQVRETAAQAPSSVLIRTIEALAARPDSGPTLPTISVPVLILVGDEDTVTPLPLAERMAREIPGAQLAKIPDAGHLSPWENPDASNRAIEEMLRFNYDFS